MATKKTPAERLRERLDGLSHAIPDELRLPSLEANRLGPPQKARKGLMRVSGQGGSDIVSWST
jgi:hypothetical protein